MRQSLDILVKWCGEWSVEVNVEKCGVMHRKGVKRTEELEVLCWWKGDWNSGRVSGVCSG